MKWEKQKAMSDGLEDAESVISSTVEFTSIFNVR
jgi:hypothetical protein